MKSPLRLEQIFQDHLQTLALTLRPGTIQNYRCVARRFLQYLHTTFPQLRRLSQLRRDPHILGWFRSLCEQDPPLCNKTRADHLLLLRRLLDDLAANGHPLQPGLIRLEDFPPRPQYLPRPLSLPDDQLLQQELRRTDDLLANALLLTRATGIRIGECIDLAPDCVRQLGPEKWALHVPLGKLHTERLVPLDEEARRLVTRLLALRPLAPPAHLAKSAGWLLPRGGRNSLYETLRQALAAAAQRAGCSSSPVAAHRLRHSWATEMLRWRVSLPALMHLLGHKRYPHDLALSPGHPTRPAARVPPGAAERGSPPPASRTLRAPLHFQRQSSHHSPSLGGCTSPPGDVPAADQR